MRRAISLNARIARRERRAYEYPSLMPDLFTPSGIAAWRARLDASEQFRTAARGWTGSVLLVDDSKHRATYVAIDDGVINAAREADTGDRDAAEFVLRASAETWAKLVSGRLELMTAALSGLLHLDRGKVLRLLPHAGAAAAMLREVSPES